MGLIFKKVDRSEIILQGHVSPEKLHEAFDKICGDRLASLKVVNDDEHGTTTVYIYPCRTFKILNDALPHHKLPASEERKLRITGLLPGYYDVVEECWVPIRKRAKKAKDEMQWVVMYPPSRVIDRETSSVSTELGFIVDFRCKKELECDTLDRATDTIAECLRKLVSDIRLSLMPAALLVEELSMALCEKIDQMDMDETEAKYREKGLRYVNTDAMVQND